MNIGDKVVLKNSISIQIGEVKDLLLSDITYLNNNNEVVILARKGDLRVKFPFHLNEGSCSYYSPSELKKHE